MNRDEALSAMMDGEAQDLEVRRVLAELPSRPEELARWRRYHLAREAMAGGHLSTVDLVTGVRAAIEQEVAGDRAPAAPWRRAVGSFAVAASVAAVVLVGGQQYFGGNSAPEPRVGPVAGGVVNAVGAVPVQASFGQQRAAPALQPADRTAYRELARQRLRRYALEHAEHAALNTPAGMVPFARVPHIEAAGETDDTAPAPEPR